jgi:hypothetical protein
MPRPVNKSQLLSESQKEYEALEKFMAALPAEQMLQPGAIGEWSVKDVVAHLLEWQQMIMLWYAAGLRGENPPVPAEGYKWNEIPALNQFIYQKYRDRPLEDIFAAFRASHRQTMQLVESLSEEVLFTPGFYAWTRTNKLATYITANTGSHYRWARTTMRKGLKSSAQPL